MNKLVLISCYMGNFPSYFNLFVESCRWNPQIDWLIFSDCPPLTYEIPSNVRIEYLTLTEVQELAFRKIGRWIKLNRAYKLCDFKPTYGLLFSEWITGYEYWGHCDIDVIWGRLQTKILPLLDKRADRYFKYGHLSIYRNVVEINESFKLPYSGIQYKKALSTSISCGFDEMKGTWVLAQENGLKVYHEEIVFDIKRPGALNYLQSYTSKNYPCQYFLYKDKRILHCFKNEEGVWKNEERAYIHFQKRNLQIINSNVKNKDFQITEYGIVEITASDSIDMFLSRNQVRNISVLKSIYYKLNDFWGAFRFKLLKINS